MAPPKAARVGQDDAKPDAPQGKEKSGHGSSTNGKSRRTANANGSSQQRDASAAGPPQPESPPTPVVPVPEPINPAVSTQSAGILRANAFRHVLLTWFLQLLASMVVVRSSHPPRLPSRTSVDHADVVCEPLPPVGALTTGRHRPTLPYDGAKEGVSATEQGSACVCREEAFQRLGDTGE